MSGIDRNVKIVRGCSGKLKILKERKILGMKILRFLLMENVAIYFQNCTEKISEAGRITLKVLVIITRYIH